MLDQMNICVLVLHLVNEAYNIIQIKNQKNKRFNVKLLVLLNKFNSNNKPVQKDPNPLVVTRLLKEAIISSNCII